MDQALQEFVRRRANEACEYCRLPQTATRVARFHIEHVIARQHGGASSEDNLALACAFCNFHKGPNIAAIDHETGSLVPLFHPRRERWIEHFSWDETHIVGITAIGRATVALLAMNDWQRVELRDTLRSLGEPFCG